MNTDKIYAESIVNEYSVKQTSKVVALKKLDRKAKQPSNIFAYVFGILSALLFGTGMCLAMEVIGSGAAMMALGVVVGCVGIGGCGVNYPIYKRLRQKGMAKYASDIMRLAKEISEE